MRQYQYICTQKGREDLLREVWDEPVKNVAKRYGVTDTALANRCKRLEIPLPGRGYWAKKAAGKEVPSRPELSPINRDVSKYINEYAIFWKDTEDFTDEMLIEEGPYHLLEIILQKAKAQVLWLDPFIKYSDEVLGEGVHITSIGKTIFKRK